MAQNRYMQIAIDEAREGIRNGHGGPFGTAIVKDGVLIRKFICDNEGCERDSLDYCEECDKDFDPPMFTLLTFDPSRKYVCPRCGTDLLKQFKPTVKSFELKLINNEWIFPNGFAPIK